MNKQPTERDLDHFVHANVNACVSALVSTLARAGEANDKDLCALCEQAFDLEVPIPDYEESLNSGSYEIRHDMHGFYWCSPEECAEEDAGAPSAGFDGRGHYPTIEDAKAHAQPTCDAFGLDPYEWEVYEHWAVSEWFAEKLAAHGEKVDKDFAGLAVWARTITGQAISMDSVVKAIWCELHAEDR